jgi:cytochrome b6
LLILAIHIYLIQKQGMSVPFSVEAGKEKLKELPFWPNFVYREIIVWLVLFGALITVAVFLPPSLGKAADLMAPAPKGIKPEWYFLFLFQTLKLFPGKILFINGDTIAVFLIVAALVLFFFLPFLDNKPDKMKGRVITWLAWATIAYAVGMSVWSLLT